MLTPALIAQLILQFGIPAAREILVLFRSKTEPTLDEWLATLDKAEVHAKAFLARTASLDPSATSGTDVPANPEA